MIEEDDYTVFCSNCLCELTYAGCMCGSRDQRNSRSKAVDVNEVRRMIVRRSV